MEKKRKQKYKLFCGDNVKILREKFSNNKINLVVTSPPYGMLREYDGFSWDFEGVVKELYRVLKPGGVVVWVIGDQTINGSETGESFRQVLYFMENGFKLHDTMIYKKHSPFPPNNRYWQCFEYMFVLSKGKLKTFNPLMQEKKFFTNKPQTKTFRQKDGSLIHLNKKEIKRFKKACKNKYRIADNIWDMPAGYQKSSSDKVAFKHPAIFPEELAKRHILSWSNVGDLVLDPFTGSGTTLKMALLLGRRGVGIEVNPEYCRIIKKRLDNIGIMC